MNTREELLDYLKNESEVLRDESLERAFTEIDRADFILGDYLPEAYEDYSLPLIEGRSIIKPTLLAFMLELLDVQIGDKVLDIVAGTGFSTALIAHMVNVDGEVLGLERSEDLLRFSREALGKYGFPQANIHNSKEVELNKEGFDKILLVENTEFIPEEIIEALKEDGLMVAVLSGEIKVLRKHQEDLIEERSIHGFTFDDFTGF